MSKIIKNLYRIYRVEETYKKGIIQNYYSIYCKNITNTDIICGLEIYDKKERIIPSIRDCIELTKDRHPVSGKTEHPFFVLHCILMPFLFDFKKRYYFTVQGFSKTGIVGVI